jgi:hypothetical protein
MASSQCLLHIGWATLRLKHRAVGFIQSQDTKCAMRGLHQAVSDLLSPSLRRIAESTMSSDNCNLSVNIYSNPIFMLDYCSFKGLCDQTPTVQASASCVKANQPWPAEMNTGLDVGHCYFGTGSVHAAIRLPPC